MLFSLIVLFIVSAEIYVLVFFFLFCQVVDGFSVVVIYLGSKWPLYGLIPNKENTSVLLGIEVPKLLLCSTFCCRIVLDMTRIKDIPKTLYANKNVKIIQKSNHKWSIFLYNICVSGYNSFLFFFRSPKCYDALICLILFRWPRGLSYSKQSLLYIYKPLQKECKSQFVSRLIYCSLFKTLLLRLKAKSRQNQCYLNHDIVSKHKCKCCIIRINQPVLTDTQNLCQTNYPRAMKKCHFIAWVCYIYDINCILKFHCYFRCYSILKQ